MDRRQFSHGGARANVEVFHTLLYATRNGKGSLLTISRLHDTQVLYKHNSDHDPGCIGFVFLYVP